MLKFRMTNSMRARKAAEGQRKILEEKLKMEWAWKPMAAIMNEKESDLVYWVPPLYTSNLLTSFSSSSSRCSSVTSSPIASMRRASVQFPPSGMIQRSPSIRRKKLSTRRRPRLTPEQSIQEDDDEDELPSSSNPVPHSSNNFPEDSEEKRKKDDVHTDDDKESGIHEDSALEDEPNLWEDTFKVGRKPMRQNAYRVRHSCPENISAYTKKNETFRHIPTLLKVVNKLSQIYTLPKRSTPIVAAKRFERNKESRNSSIRRPKRPSVKIYNIPSSTRSSLKKAKLSEEDAKPDPYYVITKTKTPFGNRSSIKNKPVNNRTHIGLPTMSESELQNAHLEMILKILAHLYEEKLTEQTTEISHLKSKLQGQEKVLKQTAHLALELKDQMKTLQARFDFSQKLQKFYNKEDTDPEPSFPYHALEPLTEESPSTTPSVTPSATPLSERHPFKSGKSFDTPSVAARINLIRHKSLFRSFSQTSESDFEYKYPQRNEKKSISTQSSLQSIDGSENDEDENNQSEIKYSGINQSSPARYFQNSQVNKNSVGIHTSVLQVEVNNPSSSLYRGQVSPAETKDASSLI